MPHSRYQIPSHVYTFDQHGECSKGPDWVCPARPCPAAQGPRKLYPLRDPYYKPYEPKLDCCQKGGDEEKGGPNQLDGVIKCEVEVKSDFVPNISGADTESGMAKPKPAPCIPICPPCWWYWCCPPEEICKARADRGGTGGGGDIANAEGWYPDESDELCCTNPYCFTCLGNCALPKPGGYDFPLLGPGKCKGHCHVACCDECKPKKERKWPNIRCINPHKNKPCPPKLKNDPCRPSKDPCCEPPQLWKNDPAPEHTPESFRIISLLCTPESSKPVVESDLLGHPDARVADSVRICGICDGARPPPTDWRLGKYDPALSPFVTSCFPDRYHPGQCVRNYKPPCPGPCPCKISTPVQCPESCSPYCPQNTCNPGFVAYPTSPNPQVPNPQWSIGGAQSPMHQIGNLVPQGVCVPACSPCGPYGPCDPMRMGNAWPCSPCDPCNYYGAIGPVGPGPLGPCCASYPCHPCVPCGPWGPIPNFPCKSTVPPGCRMTCGSETPPKERLAGGGVCPGKVNEKRPQTIPKKISEERLSSGGSGKKSPTNRFTSGGEVPCSGPPWCGPRPLPKPPQGVPWGQVRPQGYLAGPSTNFNYVTGPCNTGAPCYEPCDPGKPVIPCNPVNPCRRACCPVCAPPRCQCYAPSRCRKCKPCCPLVCPGTMCPPPLQRSCRDLEQCPRACQACTDCRPKVVEEEVRTTCKHWREAPNPQYFSVCSNQRACCDVGPQLLTEEQLSMFRRCIEHPQPWYYPCSPCGPVVPSGVPFPPCPHQRSQSPAPPDADICTVPEEPVGMTRDDPEIVVCPPGTYRLRSPGRPPLEGAQVCAAGTAKFKGVREQSPPRDWEMNRRTAVRDLMDPKIPQACYDSSVCVPLGFPRAPTRNPVLPPCPPCPDPNKPPQPPGCAKDTQSKPSCSGEK